ELRGVMAAVLGAGLRFQNHRLGHGISRCGQTKKGTPRRGVFRRNHLYWKEVLFQPGHALARGGGDFVLGSHSAVVRCPFVRCRTDQSSATVVEPDRIAGLGPRTAGNGPRANDYSPQRARTFSDSWVTTRLTCSSSRWISSIRLRRSQENVSSFSCDSWSNSAWSIWQ